MKGLLIKFNLKDDEYLTALRLAAGAVASLKEIDLDTAEDFKVCVTESVLILKNCGFEEVAVNFKTEEGVYCIAEGLGGQPKEGENELSLALISALMEHCEIERSGDIIKRVCLKIC